MNDFIKSVLPTIATALGGPLAGLAVDAVSKAIGIDTKDTEVIKSVLNGMPPEKVAELKQIDADLQVKLAQLGFDNTQKIEAINASVIDTVNKTMQVEANSDHWQTYSWRPFIGFAFGLYVISLFMLPLFDVKPVELSNDMVLAIGGILGVASWFRGRQQLEVCKSTGSADLRG